jgi:hypothetical protein
MSESKKQHVKDDSIIIILLGCLIGLGFYGLSMSFRPEGLSRFFWEIILFSFIVGTILLTGNIGFESVEKQRELIRLGSTFVLCGIIILVGAGIRSFSETMYLFNIVGNIILFGGFFFLSCLIAALFLEFGKRITS